MPTLTTTALESSKQNLNILLQNANLTGCRVYFETANLITTIHEIIPLLPDFELPASPMIKPRTLSLISRTFHHEHRTLTLNLQIFTQLYIDNRLQEQEETNPIVGYIEINHTDIVQIKANRQIPQFQPVQWIENFLLGPIA